MTEDRTAIEEYKQRFDALAAEAKAAGVESATVLREDDRFADAESTSMITKGCGVAAGVGMFQIGIWLLKRTYFEDGIEEEE